MNLPQIITDLIKAQDNFDSAAYADCFATTAEVSDEGASHKGKDEIREWIANANKKYQAIMLPISFKEMQNGGVLTASISGTFEGSPIVLKYHFEIRDGFIHSLEITG